MKGEKIMKRKKEVGLWKAAASFMETRAMIREELGTVGGGEKMLNDIKNTVQVGIYDEIFIIVMFLNGFIFGSPRHYNILKFRLKDNPDVLEKLEREGLKIHGKSCEDREKKLDALREKIADISNRFLNLSLELDKLAGISVRRTIL